MKSVILTLLGLSVFLCGPVAAGELEIEHYSSNPDMQLPFSDAVRVGNMLYLSGKIGNIPGTSELAEGGIQGDRGVP